MKIEIDTHTHTIVSGHAYNSLKEMVETAAEKGLKGLAVTEHAPEMPGTCHAFYFMNLRVVPREMNGIKLFLGAELNIMDPDGTVDLKEEVLCGLDVRIASIHTPCYGKSRGLSANTDAYVNAMKQPFIDIIGHPDDGRFEADYEVLAKTAKETGTLLEVNNSSLRPGGFRFNTYENTLKLLSYCKKYETMITLGSDAHIDVDIANCSYSEQAVKDAEFPEALIANLSLAKFQEVLKKNR